MDTTELEQPVEVTTAENTETPSVAGAFFALGMIVFAIFTMGFFFGHQSAGLFRSQPPREPRPRGGNRYGEIDDL